MGAQFWKAMQLLWEALLIVTKQLQKHEQNWYLGLEWLWTNDDEFIGNVF